MSRFAGAPGSVPSNVANDGALELNTIVYVRCPDMSVGSRLMIGRLLLISIATLLLSTGAGVGLAVGVGLALGLGLGLGLGEGDGLPGGFKMLLVLVI